MSSRSADNIFLGREFTPVRHREPAAARMPRLEKLLDRIGHTLDPSRLVRTLSIADKQMVEIAKGALLQRERADHGRADRDAHRAGSPARCSASWISCESPG